MTAALRFELWPGFEVASPVWVASAHFSDSPKVIDWLKEASPALITLKSTSAEAGGTGTGQRLLVPVGTDSIYTDGSKSKELLNVQTTIGLLEYAKRVLPDARVGVSVMMGERYSELHNVFRLADFAELNLKYSVRPPRDGTTGYCASAQTQFEQICEETEKFLAEFSNVPSLIKLTREIPWLRDCDEFRRLVQICDQFPTVGFIVANTRRSIIPASVAGRELDLVDGVLAGGQLFSETFNLIRTLASVIPNRMPIVATGGIMNLDRALDALRAGASALQVCSLIHLNGLSAYTRLQADLQDRLEQNGFKTFPDFLVGIRGGSFPIQRSQVSAYHRSFSQLTQNGFFQEFLLESKRLDVLVTYARSWTRDNRLALEERFRVSDWSTRVLTMHHNSPFLEPLAASWGISPDTLRERIKEVHSLWRDIHQATPDPKGSLEIRQHHRCPFQSIYQNGRRCLSSTYPLVGDRDVPGFEFERNTDEYARLQLEFARLWATAEHVFP